MKNVRSWNWKPSIASLYNIIRKNYPECNFDILEVSLWELFFAKINENLGESVFITDHAPLRTIGISSISGTGEA